MKLLIYKDIKNNITHASADVTATGCRIKWPNVNLSFAGTKDFTDLMEFLDNVNCPKCQNAFSKKILAEDNQNRRRKAHRKSTDFDWDELVAENNRSSKKAETLDELYQKYSAHAETKSAPKITEVQENNCMINGNILTLCLGGEKMITIPDRVKIIEKSAFVRCSELTSLEIPHTVTEIRDYAFALCHNLTEITLPQTAKLGRNVFYGCSALELVKIRFPNGAVGTFTGDAAESMFEKL